MWEKIYRSPIPPLSTYHQKIPYIEKFYFVGFVSCTKMDLNGCGEHVGCSERRAGRADGLGWKHIARGFALAMYRHSDIRTTPIRIVSVRGGNGDRSLRVSRKVVGRPSSRVARAKARGMDLSRKRFARGNHFFFFVVVVVVVVCCRRWNAR